MVLRAELSQDGSVPSEASRRSESVRVVERNDYIRASQLHMMSQWQYWHNSAFPLKHTEMLYAPSLCRGHGPLSIVYRGTTWKSSINMLLSELSLPTSSPSLTHPSHGQDWRWTSTEKQKTGLLKWKLSSCWSLSVTLEWKSCVCNDRSIVYASSPISWIYQTLGPSMLWTYGNQYVQLTPCFWTSLLYV